MADDQRFALGHQIGELTQAVRSLTERVETMERELEAMTAAVSRGKGILFGVMLVLGFGVAQLKDAVASWLK